MYHEAFAQMKKLLGQLDKWLDTAVAHAKSRSFDPNLFLGFRLAPDQFAFARQVQVACDTAKLAASRLTGKDAQTQADTEQTIDELKARIAKTLAHVKSLDRAKIDAAADREITFPLGPVNKGSMKGDDYLTHFVLPNFYFHLTAAYAILRHAGVEVGKRDFLGQIPMKMT